MACRIIPSPPTHVNQAQFFTIRNMNLRIFVYIILLTTGAIFVNAQGDKCDAFYVGANHRFAGRWDEAITELTKAIDLKCELGRAYFLRGEARWGQKDYNGAWADATKAIPLMEEPAAGHQLRGQLAFAKADYKTALAEFTRSIELNCSYLNAHIFRAETYEQLGNTEGAIADYARVIALGRENAVPETYLARAKAFTPKSGVSTHYTRAQELYQEGKNAEAIASMTKAIAADPKRPEYLTARAKFNIQLRKLITALPDLNRSIAICGTPEAYALRANMHIEQGSYDKAIDDLERGVHLLKASPDTNVSLNQDATLAGVYGLGGRASSFIPSSDAEANKYYFYNGLYDDAKNDTSSGQFGLAIAKFTAAMAYFPDKVEFLAERGQIWLELGKPQLALADFDRSLVVAPKIIYVQIYRSRALHAMKRYADAFEAADIAIDRLPEDDPSLPDAYLARAAASCALGKKADAALDEAVYTMFPYATEIKTRCR